MNPLEIARFLEELIRSETKVVAFSVASVILTIVAVYVIRKWIFPSADAEKLKTEIAKKEAEIARKETRVLELEHKAGESEIKIAALKELNEAAQEKHQRENAVRQERIAGLSNQCEELTEEKVDLQGKIDVLTRQVKDVKHEYDSLVRAARKKIALYKSQAVAALNQMGVTGIPQRWGDSLRNLE